MRVGAGNVNRAAVGEHHRAGSVITNEGRAFERALNEVQRAGGHQQGAGADPGRSAKLTSDVQQALHANRARSVQVEGCVTLVADEEFSGPHAETDRKAAAADVVKA